jgi:hypothetical protein
MQMQSDEGGQCAEGRLFLADGALLAPDVLMQKVNSRSPVSHTKLGYFSKHPKSANEKTGRSGIRFCQTKQIRGGISLVGYFQEY